MQFGDERGDTPEEALCEHCVTSSGEQQEGGHHREHRDGECHHIWLPGPGQVIQCSNVDTVSLPRPAPAPAPAWTVRAGPWQTSVN